MKLYLVQHGVAKPKEEDPERPLTEQGLADIKRTAAWAAARGDIKLQVLSHSGKKRAEQSAEILAEALKPVRGFFKVNDLDPKADPNVWRDRANLMEKDLMLVGHLPHLSRLASLLLTGSPDKQPVTFVNAGIVCLQRDDTNGWSVAWTATPDQMVPAM